MKRNSKILSFIICVMLITAIALSMVSCSEKPVNTGEKTFTLIVEELDGKQQSFTVTSSKQTVGQALIDEKLIEGEDGQYGLYIKKVCGIEADYDKDQTYWAFYINGEYAMTGVDKTDIIDGTEYKLKIEK